MRVSRADLAILAAPAALALVVVVLGLIGLYFAHEHADDVRSDLKRVAGARLAVQSRLVQATDEEREIRTRMSEYRKLLERGVIGDERRLDWVEIVKNIRAERGIFDLRYSIESRRPLDYPGIKRVPGVEVMASRMTLDGSLLHEGDLFTLLTDLRARLAPYVLVRSCTLSRDPQARPDAYGAHLRSQCSIDLVTIRD